MQRDPVRAIIQAGVFLLLYVVCVTLLGALGGFVGGYLVGLTVGSLLAASLATAFAMAIFGGRPLVEVGLFWNRLARVNVLWGLAGGAGAAVLAIAPALVFHAAHFVQSPEAGANWRTLLFVPLLLLCGAAAEELLFHGFGFQVLVREIGGYATVIPIGILFGFLHSNNPNASRLGLINTAGFGILFGIAFLRSRDLWLPMGLHFGWNITLPLFGVNLSGITIKPTGVTLLWNVDSLWSGGEYGPEASILTSGVLVLLLLYILKIPVARQHAPLLDIPPEVTQEPTQEPPVPSA